LFSNFLLIEKKKDDRKELHVWLDLDVLDSSAGSPFSRSSFPSFPSFGGKIK
jgi:hypothetical protein